MSFLLFDISLRSVQSVQLLQCHYISSFILCSISRQLSEPQDVLQSGDHWRSVRSVIKKNPGSVEQAGAGRAAGVQGGAQHLLPPRPPLLLQQPAPADPRRPRHHVLPAASLHLRAGLRLRTLRAVEDVDLRQGGDCRHTGPGQGRSGGSWYQHQQL